MKINLLVLITVGLILILAAGVTATEPAIQVTGNASSSNARPGDSVGYSITFTNSGTLSATSASYRVTTGSDITGHSTGWVYMGNIGGSSSQVVTLPLKISDDAFIGFHTITVEAKYFGTQQYQIQAALSLEVKSDAQIYLQDITYDTEKLEPGTTATLTAHIKNLGTSVVKKITSEFSCNSSDIIPVLAGAEHYEPELLAWQEKGFDFTVNIDSSAESKTYAATLTLTYEDEQGNSGTKVFDIGIPISGTPLLEIVNTKIDAGDLKIELSNLGTAKAKAIRLEVWQSDTLMGVDVDNELKADKHTTMRFDTYQAGPADIVLTYLDENNQRYNTTTPISVPSSAGGGGSAGGLVSYVFFIIIIVETYFLFKYRKKLKAK